MNEKHVVKIHAGAQERRCIGDVRRRDECQPTPILCEAREGRQQQFQLTDPGAVEQDFDQRPLGPAAVQHGIEFRITGRQAGWRETGACAPDVGALHQIFEAHRSLLGRIEPIASMGKRASFTVSLSITAQLSHQHALDTDPPRGIDQGADLRVFRRELDPAVAEGLVTLQGRFFLVD